MSASSVGFTDASTSVGMQLQPNPIQIPCIQAPPKKEEKTNPLTSLFQKVAVPDSFKTCATYLFQKVGVPDSFKTCVTYVRKFTFIELPVVVFLRGVNAVTKLWRPLFSDESLATIKQQERLAEIAQLKEKLKNKADCLAFCSVARNYVDSILPSIVADLLRTMPLTAENTGYYYVGILTPYKAGYLLRYLNYQLDRRTHYREAVVGSSVAKFFEQAYCSVRTRATSCVLSKSVTGLWVDFEHVFLSLCNKIVDAEAIMKEEAAHALSINSPTIIATTTPKRVAAILHSLATMLGSQNELETYIGSLGVGVDSPDAYIARLQWHKDKNTLPPGVPDPSKIKLKRDTLSQELDRALYEYMNTLSELFLDRHAPKGIQEGFAGFLYWLEGKEFFKGVLSSLTAEVGIKQLVDPDLLTILLLSVFGVETMEHEPDKFGRNTRIPIVKAGHKMVKEAIKKQSDAYSIGNLFVRSGLTCAPGNVNAILQRNEAKGLLKKFFSGLIRDAIKGGEREGASSYKSVRESANSIPVVGVATRGIDLLVRGVFHSFQYCMGNTRGNDTFLMTMAKNFAGSDFCDYLADRVIGLIYHPSWRITLLHLMDTLVKSLTIDDYNKDISEQELKNNFNTVASFLFDHLTGDALKGKLGDWAMYFTGEKAFDAFRARMQPEGVPILEKGLPLILPTLKELLLFERISAYFRSRGVEFEGDAKFWECFVREYLNQIVSISVPERAETKFSLAQAQVRAKVRSELVDTFISLDIEALLKNFAKPPVSHKVAETVSRITVPTYKIIENYVAK